jgi:hypothetical protein
MAFHPEYRRDGSDLLKTNKKRTDETLIEGLIRTNYSPPQKGMNKSMASKAIVIF